MNIVLLGVFRGGLEHYVLWRSTYKRTDQQLFKLIYKILFQGRDNLAEMKETFHKLDKFASRDESMEGLSLLETIKKVRPSILIGLSACGGLFTKEILQTMAEFNNQPIIFPLSNPTSRY